MTILSTHPYNRSRLRNLGIGLQALCILPLFLVGACANNVSFKSDGVLIYGEKTGKLQYLEEKDKDFGLVKKVTFDGPGEEGTYSIKVFKNENMLKMCEESSWKKTSNGYSGGGGPVFIPAAGAGGRMTMIGIGGGGGSSEPQYAPSHSVECQPTQFYDTMQVEVYRFGKKISRYRLLTKK